MKPLLAMILILGFEAPSQAPPVPELIAARVKVLPTVDGKGDDAAWKSAAELVVKVDELNNLKEPKRKLTLKAVHDGESIAFLMSWEDATKSDTHESYVWNAEKKAYEIDSADLEDSATIAFEHVGVFNPNMLAGVESQWDVWQWKAARTDPKGYSEDKVHIYSKKKPEGVTSNKTEDDDQKPLWIARVGDKGNPPFRQLDAPKEFKGARASRWEAQEPSESAADVRAKGSWASGRWTVEFMRKLNTGHEDDTPFDPQKAYSFAIATHDKTDGGEHVVSTTLRLVFGK